MEQQTEYRDLINYEALANQMQDNFEMRIQNLIETQKYALAEFLHGLVNSIVLPAVGSKYSNIKFLVSEDTEDPVEFIDDENIVVNAKTFLFLGGITSAVLLIGACFVQHFGEKCNLIANKDYTKMMHSALSRIGVVYEDQMVARAIIRYRFKLPEDIQEQFTG